MPHYVLDARASTPHFPGIGRYCRSLARALVPLLAVDECLSVLHAPSHPLDLPDFPTVTGIPVESSPFSLRQQWAVPRILRQGGADVYHAAYYLMPYRPGIPTLVTFYDFIPVRFPRYSTLRARLLFHLASQLAYKTAVRGIAISSATRQDMVRYLRAEPEKIARIPLAAALQFSPQPSGAVNSILEKYHLPDAFILYLGSNKPHKNLESLVRAFADLRDLEIPLVVAGAWLPQHPEPRRLVEELGLGETQIRWLGPVPGEDLPALYSAAFIFVFPSLVEGFGLPVLEAMACGTPVACSRIPSLKEVAGGAAEMFDPTDPASISASLLGLVRDPARQQELRQQGFRRAAEFSWDKTAQATLDQYRACLA
jgi:glycosyltransferase involved in cell wall biosynthesis